MIYTMRGRLDSAGYPIACQEFVDDGKTRRCGRCGWWRGSHRQKKSA